LGNAGTLIVGTQLAYTVAQSIIVVYDANNFQECEVTAYNPATGSLSFAAPTRTAGGGTYSAWSVNLDGASGGDGSSGTSGTSATAGTSGSTGTSGSSGSSGSSGTSGSSGSAGTAGTSGRNGIDGSSGASIANWYGAFTSTATQVVTGANTPTAITYTNDEYSNGIVFSGSQLTVQHTGIYEIAYSLQVEHTGAGGADVNIWLKKNGANIIRTDSILGLRNQSSKQLPFVSIIDSANANDYYEVYFQANASDVQVTAVAATGTIPAAPSIITNIKQIGIAVGTTSGTSGSSGSSGSSGINGSSGNTGSSGSAGSSGSSGTSGVDGSTGSSGSAGSSGSSGSSGTTGTSGSSATSGTSGTSGSAGSSGSSGTTGTSGTSATSGSTGTSGSSGTSGNATTSARAVQTFTSTSGQTTFTVTNGYNLGMVDVFVNGVKFVNGTDFTATNGTTVVMAAGLAAGNIVEIDNLLTAYLPTNALRTITTFTATAGQTTFSVSYTQGLIDVFYNGSNLAQSEYTATNGTSIILATACQLNDIVVVYAYSYSVGAYSGIGGSGTTNYHAKFTGTNTIGNSLIFDNGTNVGIGNTNTTYTLDVSGTLRTTGALTIGSSSSFNGTILNTSGGYTTSVELGYRLRNDANSANLGGLVRRSYWAGGAALDTQIFAETGYGIYLNVNGSATSGINITSAGQLGIGTSSVDSNISVDIQNLSPTSNNVFLRIKNNNGSEDVGLKIAGTFGTAFEHTIGVNTIIASGDLCFHNANGLGYRWFIDGTQRLSITSGGFTKQSNGDYTYLANASHETTSTTNSNYIDIITHRNTNPYGIFIDYPNASPNNSGNEFIACEDSTNSKFYVYANGNLANRNGTYGTISSDLRLKENIIEASSKLNDILNLRVVNFNLKEDTDKKKQIGFIAQEFKEVFPSLVYEKDTREYDEDGNVTKGLEDSLGLNVGMEFAILVKAIQEMNTKIIELEKIVATK
jgi:hypothetical protein